MPTSSRLRLAGYRGVLYAATFVCGCLATAPLCSAFAQSATTGAISGTVTDTGGALLPGTIVSIKSAETGTTRTVKTNSSGEFILSELPPGTYTVSIKADGFDSLEETGVAVTVGGTANLLPKLKVGSVAEKVEVNNESVALQTDDNAITTTLTQDLLDNLPINGRRWSSFALLTPGVVSNGDGFGLLSFRGISYLLNNSTVDGVDNNQAYFSEERGRTRASYSISQAAVQEFQVNTSNYSAEYGRAAGGVINTVTKSGSNAYHGEIFFYDRDNDFGASNPYTQLITQQPGTNNFVAQNYKPKDWRKQWGFGVGGYIIKDKLFWFYSYDQSRRNFPGTARASDPSDTFAPADAVLPTGVTCANAAAGGYYGDSDACNLATALGVSYQAAAAYYGQGLGVIATFLGAVPRFSDQVLNFPRLDWQINDKNRATIQYNRLRYSSPAGVQTQASNFYGRASFGNDYVKEDFGIFRFTSVLSSSLVNEFRAQYGRDFEYEYNQKPLPNEQPLVSAFGTPPDINIAYEFDLQGFDIGGTYLGVRNAYPDERRIQLSDGVTYSRGAHTFKAGVDVNRVFEHINNLYEGTGSYSYDYNWDFISDYLHKTTGLGGANYTQQFYSYTQGFGNPSIGFATTDYDGYLTDNWRATPNLTLTAGVRYEYEYVPGNPYVNTGNTALNLPALPQTADKPDDRNNFAPRVGFVWNIYGNGKTTLKGGYGMYFGRIIGASIGLAYQNSGSPNGQLALTTTTTKTSTNCDIFPNAYSSSESVGPAAITAQNCAFQTPTVAYLDPHMQNPQVHEADIALEQQLGWKTVLSLTYMDSFGRELPSVFDTNAPVGNSTSTFTVRNDLSTTPGGGVTGTVLPRGGQAPPLLQGSVHTYKQYTGTRPNASYYAIYAVQSEANSNYNALSVQLNKRFSNQLSFLNNFTWAHALDYNPYLGTSYGSSSYLPVDPLNKAQDYGNSNLNVAKRFVSSVRYNPNFNLTGYRDVVYDNWGLSATFQTQTGLPYSATTSGTNSGAALSGPLGSGGAARLPKFDFFGNLETERNSYSYPIDAVLDMRLSKNFTTEMFGTHYRLEILGEAFNTLNHQNITSISTGSYTICTKAGTVGVAGGCPAVSYPSGTGLLVYNSNFGTYKNSNSNVTYTPRQLQVAVRLHF